MEFIRGNGITAGYGPRKTNRRIAVQNYLLNCLIIMLLSAGLSGIGVMLSDVLDMNNLKRYVYAPMLFFLNTLPLTLFLLLIYHLSSRLWVSFGLGGGLFLVLQIVNRFKMELREEPLTLPDFLMGTEAAKVVRLSGLPFGLLEGFGLLLWLGITILLFRFFRPKRLPWPGKVIGSIAAAGIFLLSFPTFYSDAARYKSFPVQGSEYSRVNQFKSHGFLYSFLVNASTFRSVKPDGYSRAAAARILDGYDSSGNRSNPDPGALPHVITVMGEAFYDIDRIKGMEWNEGYHPLENFSRISSQAYSGRIVTDVFGGGTANTEFAFLTGHSLAIMPGMGSPYTSYLRKDTYSLVRVLEKAGYSTLAFHPGETWFYNRSNVYRFFGFDRILFRKAMGAEKVGYTNGYVSDLNTAEFALARLKSHIAEKPGVPLFEFVVNIGNHGPYSKESLGYPQMLKRNPSMDTATYNILNNYVNGLAFCDQAIGSLADSLDKLGEPVVLLYFSDHLPFLGEKNAGYKALNFPVSQSGSLEAYLNQYETPWFIWCNKAARDQLQARGVSAAIGAAPEISTNYLGGELLKYIGVDGGKYLNFLSELEQSMPVISSRFYQISGSYVETLSGKYKEQLNRYRELQYYMLMEKEAAEP